MPAPSSPSLFCKSGGHGGFIGDRNAYDKRAPALVRIVPAQDFATMGAHDAVANAQTEAGAFAGLLGGVEGIEDPLGIGNSGSVVSDGHFNGITPQLCANRDASAVPGLLDRVIRVIEEVQENLLQLL